MAAVTPEAQTEDIDSRTATFERKRTYDVATRDDDSNAGSAQSTPRKRNKPAAKLGYQDVRDFVPSGASFTTNAPPLEDAHSGERVEASTSGSMDAAETVTAAPMNWNAVNSTKIRISLGSGREKDKTPQKQGLQATQVVGGPGEAMTRQNDKVQSSQAAESLRKVDIAQDATPRINPKPKALRKEATKVALARLEGFRDRLASMDPHDGPASAYKAAQAEVENAEVDYNYCLYYPTGPAFSPPPHRIYVPENTQMTAPKERNLLIWEQTKECMHEGTLQDLKEGRITWGTGRLAQAIDRKQASKKLRQPASGGPSSEPSKEVLRERQFDLSYCKYFPSNEEYLPLHRAKKGLSNPNDFSGERGDLNRRAAQVWKLAQQCDADGTLGALRDGRLEQCIRNVPAATQPCLAPELQTGENARSTRSNSEDGTAEDMTVTNGVQGEVELPDAAGPQAPKAASQHADVKKSGEGTPSQIYTLELSPELEGTSQVSQNGSNSDEDSVSHTYENGRLHSIELGHSREAEETNQNADKSDLHQDDVIDRIASDGSDSTTDADSISEDGDGIMDHEDSEQAAEDVVRESELNTVPDSKVARTLAELNPQDLNAQLKYFHVTKTTSEVDRNTPVKCLVCSSQGHMADVCDQLTCNVCGAFNHHTTEKCPSTAKCSKCRELGHDKGHCPYKLKNPGQIEIDCDLCHRNGHIEEDCELQWRTSGRPWESSLKGRNVRLSCYECGRSGHLGNDCPTRRPGKPLGSSTWGSGDNQISIKSKGELSIKGTASHDPIDIDDGQEEMAGAFVRHKVPKPVRKGMIQIKTRTKATHNDLGPNSGWNPVNAPYDSGRANEPSYGLYRDDGRGDWHAANGAGQQALPDRPGYDSYGQSNRRSRSPEYRDRGGYNHSDRYQPPAPREKYQNSRPPLRADVYRPMPSSAQNAWSRHRV